MVGWPSPQMAVAGATNVGVWGLCWLTEKNIKRSLVKTKLSNLGKAPKVLPVFTGMRPDRIGQQSV